MPVSLAQTLGALAIAASVLGMTAAVAAEPPKEMKLYVFTSGGLTLDKSIIQNGASGKVTIPVGFYLIRHPKGDVIVRLRSGCGRDPESASEGVSTA